MLPRPPITVTIRPFTVSGSGEQRRERADRGADHGAGDAAEQPGDDERHGVHLADADAAELRRHRLLRYGARSEAEPRAVEQREERDHANHARSPTTSSRSPRSVNSPTRSITSSNIAG